MERRRRHVERRERGNRYLLTGLWSQTERQVQIPAVGSQLNMSLKSENPTVLKVNNNEISSFIK